MKKPKALYCNRRHHVFYIAQVGDSRTGAAASKSVKGAEEAVQADVGDTVKIYKACARDAGEARVQHMGGNSIFVRRKRAK